MSGPASCEPSSTIESKIYDKESLLYQESSPDAPNSDKRSVYYQLDSMTKFFHDNHTHETLSLLKVVLGVFNKTWNPLKENLPPNLKYATITSHPFPKAHILGRPKKSGKGKNRAATVKIKNIITFWIN